MHARILLPSLFAATLLSSVALADRNDSDDRSPTKSSIKERVLREARSPEARERVQSKEAPVRVKTERAAPAKLTEKRGCATDDGGSCSSSRSKAADKSASQTKAAAKSSAPSMPTKLQAQRGCSTDDGNGCSSSSQKSEKSSAQTASADLSKHVVARTDRWSKALADEMMQMRLKIEAERLLDMLNIRTCMRKGTCGEDSY